MKPTLTFIFSFLVLGLLSEAQDGAQHAAYLNPDLPVETRVNDLISRMTLEEKVSQMVNGAREIPHLKIPAYDWWNEGLHGVARAGTATVFPQAIGMAATFDEGLIYRVADVISTEARAIYNKSIAEGKPEKYKGLTYWSPNINIFRDPRWGRGQETYGEDPFLTSRIGVAFVRGLQGEDSRYLKLVATPKHYAVHSGPEPERHTFDAVTDKRDLYTTYLPAFKACVQEGQAYSVMCAYNRYLGQACCGSDVLLKKILREEWGFDGYIVSDCGAIADIYRNHKLVNTSPEAAALAVKSGTDLNCGSIYDPALIDAVSLGLIREEEIDVSLKRLFTARFKLGMFDPPEKVPYSKIPYRENDSEEHRVLAKQVARESIVLLKNENDVLPLKKDLGKIAVIGPTAHSYNMLLGNYNGTPSRYTTPLDGITAKVSTNTEVVYEQGCKLVGEGAILKAITAGMLSYHDQPGLKVEYFKGMELSGEPFFSQTESMGKTAWLMGLGQMGGPGGMDNPGEGMDQAMEMISQMGGIGEVDWGKSIPGMERGIPYSVRWTGNLKIPVSGEINFVVTGNDGYRLYVDNKLLVEDWTADGRVTTKQNHIYLKKDKEYRILVEYFYKTGFSALAIRWDVNTDHFQHAVELAKRSDAVIFVGGITAGLEGEEMHVNFEGFRGGDRTNIGLPEIQEELIKALYETGKPVILVLTSGSALAVNWEKSNIPAIVQLWYPGEEGGSALADVLFGDYNPAGRLPITFYKSVDQLPPFEDYHMEGKTYRFFKDEPLYAFGYGMSYSRFEYSDLNLPEKIEAGEDIQVSVRVINSGGKTGDEVVQLYVETLDATVPVPIRNLQGFKRISLNPGEEKTVDFVLEPQQMAVCYDDGNFIVEPGFLRISAGGGQAGHVAETSSVLTGKVEVTGNPYRVE
ncbi:MAG: glycoside hydrolase family 3 C-terminal domain-containing protein [Mangrovibacterium sp.]